MLVVMAAAWATQKQLANAGWIDVFWTLGTGLACASAALWPSAEVNRERQILIALLAGAWSLRLGAYVALRVARSRHEDVRYATLRADWGKAFDARLIVVALVQAPATTLLAWSVFAAAHASAGPLGPRDIAGAGVLALSVLGEAFADEQMRRFKINAHRGAINDRGLWAWSRHPNYFFEWLSWLAYPAFAFSPENTASWATWAAAIVMYGVLRYGTGVPALEAAMLKSRGDAFRTYQARVSAFFLRPPKKVQT
jgi:steroid 5-alpha reductase family enzyme